MWTDKPLSGATCALGSGACAQLALPGLSAGLADGCAGFGMLPLSHLWEPPQGTLDHNQFSEGTWADVQVSDLATTEWFGVMATKRRRVAGSYVLKKQADARKSVEQ